MAEKYKVERDLSGFRVAISRGKYAGYAAANFWILGNAGDCPNAEREARNLCRRLNAAAAKKKGKGKR